MKILVLGAGGTGGYFGGRLVESGADVTFLVRPARQKLLQAQGLVLKSAKGNAQLKVQCLVAAELAQSYDLILLSCKAYDLLSSIEAVRAAVGAHTLILPILNGVGHLDVLDQEFGSEKILGGVVYIAATLGAGGEVQHLNAFDNFLFGPRCLAQSGPCAHIAEVFSRANFDSKVVENVMQDMWEKFAFLSTLAGLTCLLRGNMGEIANTTYGAELMGQMLKECEAISAAAGYAVRTEANLRAQKILSGDSALTSSMHRDLLQGARVEADAIVGDLCRRGVALGQPSTLLKTACAHLQVYSAQAIKV